MATSQPDPFAADDRWDAGSMGCGELVIELRRRVRALQPGGRLHLTALDVAAPDDLVSWCRMTGHQLRLSHYPEFLIERKGD